MLLLLLLAPQMPVWLADGCLFVMGLACGATVISYPLVCENTPARVHGLAIACVNMAGFLAVTLLSQLPNWLVAAEGSSVTGSSLRGALLVFPAILLVGGFLNATFLVRETHCKPQVEA